MSGAPRHPGGERPLLAVGRALAVASPPRPLPIRSRPRGPASRWLVGRLRPARARRGAAPASPLSRAPKRAESRQGATAKQPGVHGTTAAWPARDSGWRKARSRARALEGIEPAELRALRPGARAEPGRGGETLSVGQVRVDGLCASYCGTQKATTDNQGQTAYGSSGPDRSCAGDAKRLEKFPPYPNRAPRHSPGARSLAAAAEKIGGASGPGSWALEAFRADPAARVRAWSTEAYGDDNKCSGTLVGARVFFQGVDPQPGRWSNTPYVEPHGTAH